MSAERVERRLAAILAADVAGYSRLMGEDEAGTLARLRTHRRELIDPKVTEHKGRIVKTTGDGILIEFPSVVEAVACALAVQEGMAERNARTPENQRIVFRVGINLGDVIVEDSDIHGDGVNVAARLEAISKPGGICLSGTVRDHVGDRLDVAFDDLGEQVLKNIARPVRVYAVRLANVARTPTVSLSESHTVLALPDKPSIAVLPFQNMSGDPEQEYFADGMVEEITTALSRIRWLFVIARNSTFTYKEQAIDVKRVGRELGVRYVLEGSVRKGGGRVRITAQLIEAETGAHLWADRFDGSLEDVFDLQDKVASSVAGVIEPALQSAEIRRSRERPTSDLTAYDLYLRALPTVYFVSIEGGTAALNLLEQAIERDPNYAPALGAAAICGVWLVAQTGEVEPKRRNAIERSRRVLELAGDDAGSLIDAAYTLAFFGEDIGAMTALVDRTLTLHPSFARGWSLSANLRHLAGEPDIAIKHAQISQRLSPRDPVAMPMAFLLGLAYLLSGRFDDAAEQLRLAVQERPNNPQFLRFLACCYAHLGQLDPARECIARLRSLTDVILVPGAFAQFRNPEHRELLRSGLRLAVGVPG